MEQRFHQYFLEKTENFVFSDDCGNGQFTRQEQHASRAQKLLKQLRKMAISYHYNTAITVSRGFAQEDWIQSAMITMFECCESYDRKRPFDHYVRFMVKRRLEDQRRKLYRNNPQVSEEHHTESSTEPKRLFTSTTDSIERKAKGTNFIGPEQVSLGKEAQKILLTCIQELKETERMLFIKHEMEDVSFKKLFGLLPEFEKSFATFKRWYFEKVFSSVKNCVQSQFSV